MTERLPLADLQRWMLAAITHPAGVTAGAAVNEIDALVLASRQQTATERLAVYGNAYFARLLGVLRELFPCLRQTVADDLFDSFAVDYLQAHPPGSYTLHGLADRFAPFLAATKPADEWADFVVGLARLEHALDQVFDGPGPEESAAPADVPWRLVPGFRLLEFSHPVSSYYTAWKAGASPPWPTAGEQFVALLRRDYIVRRYELSRPQFVLLADLAAGQSLAEALRTVGGQSASPTDDLAEEIRRWFTFWSAEGFFAA